MKTDRTDLARDFSRKPSVSSSGRTILAGFFIVLFACAPEAWAGYAATNLVSDIPGVAKRTDANLVMDGKTTVYSDALKSYEPKTPTGWVRWKSVSGG